MSLFDKLFHRSIDKRIASYQQELIEKHCEEVQNIYNTMRGWRHDYRNHIAVMQSDLKTGKLDALEKYLGELNIDLNTVDTVVKTGNVTVDAILNSKLALAQNKSIRTDVTASVPETDITDVELCVIIGNLLDNAMEACMKIENEADRFIRVYIGLFKEQFYISVTNSTESTRRKKLAELITSKKGEHGLGLRRQDAAVRPPEAHGRTRPALRVVERHGARDRKRDGAHVRAGRLDVLGPGEAEHLVGVLAALCGAACLV